MPDLVPSRPLVKRPSRWGRWFRAVEFAVQLTLAVGYVLYAVRYYQITTRLNEALAELDRTDPGWRLQDIEAARAVVPDDENSALRVMAVNKLLPKPSDRWIKDDFAAELQRLRPEKRMTPEQFAHLRQCLAGVRPALEEARTLSELPQGRFPLVYARNPWDTLLGEQQNARAVIYLLDLDAMAYAEAGEAHKAVVSCRAEINAARSIGDEPLGISQLIRVAGVIIGCKTAARVLAQTRPDPNDLCELQRLLEEDNTYPYWINIARGERAFGNAVLEALESGKMSPSELGGGQDASADGLFAFAVRDNVRAAHLQFFRFTDQLQAAAEMPPYLRGPTVQQIDLELQKAGRNPATVSLAAYPKLKDACSRCHAFLRCQTVALAAERYRQAHGTWPQSPDLLTPNLIAAVPTDPFTGGPLLYHRLADGVIIYSVGLDGKDDGGNVDVVNVSEPGTDIGIRLWDPAKRRQPPAAPPNRP